MTLQRASISVWTAFVLLLSGFVIAEYHFLKASAASKPVATSAPVKKVVLDYTTIEREKARLQEKNTLLTLAYAPAKPCPTQQVPLLQSDVRKTVQAPKKKKSKRLHARRRRRMSGVHKRSRTTASTSSVSKNAKIETTSKPSAAQATPSKTLSKRRTARKLHRSKRGYDQAKSSPLKRKALKNATVQITRIRPATADVSWKRLQREALFAWPLKAEDFWVSSLFGPRRLGGRQGFHAGVDLAAVRGTPVYAASAGIILEACYSAGYGNYILIAHNRKFKTRYAHLDKILVYEGQSVSSGDCIGRVGATGFVRKSRRGGSASHLHFEVYMKGKPVNPFFFLA